MAGLYKRSIFGLFFALLLCISPAPISAESGIPGGGDPCDLFPNLPDCPKDPIIIVPGIVGSYNTLALFADKEGVQWGPVPFFKIYQGLLFRLEAEGFAQNDMLYVAYYDWRQGNAESAKEYLAPIIAEAKEKTGKVDIVAHSMGGLLVQQYIQSEDYTPGEIDEVVMLGTPNDGASAAYLLWEGGVFPSTWSAPARFYIGHIGDALRHKRDIEDIEPKSYRSIFPSLKELLPITSYLTKGGSEVPIGSVTEQNTFLGNLASLRDSLLNEVSSVTTIAGTQTDTLGEIAIGESRTAEDEALDRWRDGHPVQEVPSPNTTEGDKTVLMSSALLFGTIQVHLENVPHDSLPEYAQEEVMEALGIEFDTGEPEVFTYEEPEWLTGFVVLSPVDIVITDSTGKTVSKDTNDYGEDAYVEISSDEADDDPKVIIVKDLPNGTYTVHLTGTGTGEYTVIITNTTVDTSTTKTITGTTTFGKEESFTVTLTDGDASVSEVKDKDEGTPVPRSPEQRDGRSGEKDCCPGPDIKKEIKLVKKSKVLGTTTIRSVKRRFVPLEKLAPLNDVFFAVYGRLPTYEEWKYWADRYLTDKPDWRVLQGTMQWWKNKGISLPPPLGS